MLRFDDDDTFTISWLSEAGAKSGIKIYERMGYTKVSHRKDDAAGRIWVTFRDGKTTTQSL